MNTSGHPLRGLGQVPRHQLGLLGALSVVGAVGLILVAHGVAAAVVTVASGGDDWAGALWIGAAGVVVRALATWGRRVAAARTAGGVKRRLRSRLITRVMAGPDQRIGAATVLATRGLDDLDDYYRVFLPAVTAALVVPVLVGAAILFTDWPSAIVIALCVPLVPVFMILIGMHTRDSVAARTNALAALSDHLVELARGLPVLVGLGRVADQREALAEVSERYRRTSMATLRTAFLSALALELIATISVAVVAVIIGLRLIDGSMALQTGLFVLVLAPECFLPLRAVGTAFHASEDGLEALRRVEDVLVDDAGSDELVRLVGTPTTVQALTVGFGGRSSDAVADLAFTAPTGEVTLVAGPSGCGKSTVLGLLAGNTPGDARITGAITTPESVAWLPQHPRAVADTPLDELAAYGVGEPDRAQDLLARVGLAEAAHTDTLRLSPGELRRLAFARVLARVACGAELVVLDEPTAHLDAANAARVRGEIAAMRRNLTVVVASHDPLVHRLADTVVVLGAEDAGDPEPQIAPQITVDEPDVPRTIAPVETDGQEPVGLGAVVGELAAFLRPARWRFVASSAIAALAAAFAITLTAVSGWLIVRAGQGAAMMYLMVAIVGVRFFGVGRAVLHYLDRLLTHDAVFRSLTPLRLGLWDALARRGPADRALLGAGGTLGSLVADADSVRDLAPRVVTPLATAVLLWAGTTVAMWLILPAAGLLVLVIGAVGLVVPAVVAVVADRRAGTRAEALRADQLGAVAATFGASGDLTGNRVGGAAVARLEALDARVERAEHRAAWASGSGEALVILATGLLAFAMVPSAAAGVAGGAISAAVVAVLVLTPLGLVEPFTEVVGAVLRWPTLARVLARLHRVRCATDPVGSGSRHLDEARHIGLEDVAYRYPETTADVFAGLDAEVGPGQWLVVTGPSGSGKSTLLSLLLRHLDPTAGRYVIGGADARGFIPASVRDRIAWCPQEAHLFDSTLRGNLLLARARDDAPDEIEMRAVLARVGLGGLLDELTDGLDTRIGSAGAKLSGGQRQRVAVARTLLARADTVLVDEPTAHLDQPAARALLADLRAALSEKTTVLVTHHAVDPHPGDRALHLDRSTETPTLRTSHDDKPVRTSGGVGR